MRLQEMYHLIHSTLENWKEPVFQDHSVAGQRNLAASCENAPFIVKMLEPLQVFPAVQEKTERIYRTSKKFKTANNPRLSSEGVSAVKDSMKEIHRDLLAMADMCEALDVKPNSSGFDVKLPPNITLDEMADCIKDLNTIFSQCPILREEGHQIELRGVDVGSSWLVFSVLGKYILDGLAALTDKAVQIRSHWISCKQQEELVRKAKLSNGQLESLISVHNQIIQELKENAIEELSEANSIKDPEEKARLSHSLDLLSKWMDKGMEIYQAIGSTDEVKVLFPPVEQQVLPEIMPKLLSANEDEDAEEE